jgi:hypothetical protein
MSDREKFEAWVQKNWGVVVRESMTYKVQLEAWQASRRAALEECAKVCDERAEAYWKAYKLSQPDDVNRANQTSKECLMAPNIALPLSALLLEQRRDQRLKERTK